MMTQSRDAELASLREQNAALTETLIRITAAPERVFPQSWGLTPSETRIVNALIEAQSPLRNREINRILHPTTKYFSESNTIAVQISRIRKRLAPHGITIISRYYFGYSISPADKAKLKELVSG